ncbi:MAG: cysteine peptidase family C39 domain-containing protein [Planctomycetota bacterium]|jgi:hypothetical protein
MKTRNFVFAGILLFLTCGSAFADRQLDRTEIIQTFQTLTNQPRRTWMPASGTIQARHIAYEASTGYTTDSSVTVRYDGNRFYWEISLNSRTKEPAPEPNPPDETSVDDFDPMWNKKRVFAWDGDRYTMYFRPGNNAIVTEGFSDIPVAVNGPLTAGIVPWGYGVYTLENLLAPQSSAVELDVDGQKQIHLTILMDTNGYTLEMTFVLDPARDYAVLSRSQNNGEMASVLTTYQDYELVSGKWIPTTIYTERYKAREQMLQLTSYDYWDLTSIDITSLDPTSFRPIYETGAMVEFRSPLTEKRLSYHYSSTVDTDALLQQKLATAADEEQARNCATVAMKYVLEQLGRDVADTNLSVLAEGPQAGTTLHELRQFAQTMGLRCLAAKTNIQTLKNLKNCQAILHFPEPGHYAVLAYIDEEYAWIIDLDNNKFFYRIDLEGFMLDWRDGVALLLSNTPLNVKGDVTELSDSELHTIIGSAGAGFGDFSCTDRIQQYDVQLCPMPVFGLCGGRYRQWFCLCGCESNPEGGICTGTAMLGKIWSPCINDPEDPLACIITGEWFPQYIRACGECDPTTGECPQ